MSHFLSVTRPSRLASTTSQAGKAGAASTESDRLTIIGIRSASGSVNVIKPLSSTGGPHIQRLRFRGFKGERMGRHDRKVMPAFFTSPSKSPTATHPIFRPVFPTHSKTQCPCQQGQGHIRDPRNNHQKSKLSVQLCVLHVSQKPLSKASEQAHVAQVL